MTKKFKGSIFIDSMTRLASFEVDGKIIGTVRIPDRYKKYYSLSSLDGEELYLRPFYGSQMIALEDTHFEEEIDNLGYVYPKISSTYIKVVGIPDPLYKAMIFGKLMVHVY